MTGVCHICAEVAGRRPTRAAPVPRSGKQPSSSEKDSIAGPGDRDSHAACSVRDSTGPSHWACGHLRCTAMSAASCRALIPRFRSLLHHSLKFFPTFLGEPQLGTRSGAAHAGVQSAWVIDEDPLGDCCNAEVMAKRHIDRESALLGDDGASRISTCQSVVAQFQEKPRFLFVDVARPTHGSNDSAASPPRRLAIERGYLWRRRTCAAVVQ